jgi:uncharacterized glyoxalase superfamily protein PhnB
VAQLAAIGIVTADIAGAVRFYRLVGVDVAEPGGEDDHFEATLPNGLRLMWDTEKLIRQLYPGWQRPTSGPAVSLAFECANAQDVDETYRRVVDAGFHGKTEPYDAFWGQRYADVVDADGNVVHLFAPL